MSTSIIKANLKDLAQFEDDGSLRPKGSIYNYNLKEEIDREMGAIEAANIKVRHIRNIYKSAELCEDTTCAKNTQFQEKFVTKNHSFSDRNKRITATIFLYFLDKNGILYDENGNKRIADYTLVALTIMIAESSLQLSP